MGFPIPRKIIFILKHGPILLYYFPTYFQLPIPLIMASLFIRMRLRGKARGHEQLITSDSRNSGFSEKKEYETIDKQKG